MKNDKLFIGVAYGRGGCKIPSNIGCEIGPLEIQKIYSQNPWVMIKPDWEFELDKLQKDRFSENFVIQKMIYDVCKNQHLNHIFVGGDHSVNFAHFKAIADKLDDDDLCLVYIDAHLDIHSVESSIKEASGAPHGTNVRQLLGEADSRYAKLGDRIIPLKKENLFFIGVRSYEPAEINFVKENQIYLKETDDVDTIKKAELIANEILEKIGTRKFVLSFDFDVLCPCVFDAVQVPEYSGISLEVAGAILDKFKNSQLVGVEFVEYAPPHDTKKNSDKIVKALIDKFV